MFKGEYKSGYRYTNEAGETSGGFMTRKLKRTLIAKVGGGERYIKNRAYIMKRHD